MLIYFKKYVIAVCAIAIALPVIISTIWPFVTGQIMAASISGLLLEFALFAVGFMVGYQIFERRAERVVDGYLYLYNSDCNPQALIAHGGQLAHDISFPCNESGAWFMGCFAQACLEVGDIERARTIEAGLEDSISAAKKPSQKCGIILYLIPLVEKLGTLDEVEELIERAEKLNDTDRSEEAIQRRAFLESQRKIVHARREGDYHELVKLDESVVRSAAYPWRQRVEYAWDEASASYKLGDQEHERTCLDFVIRHGGSLALVAQAKERLSQLA